MNSVAHHLWPEDILLDVDVTERSQLFDEIGRHMEHEHGVAREAVVIALWRRERAASTALGEGIAIPHARVENLARIHVVYLRLKSPIPYDSLDGRPVSDVLVLLVPKQATEEHLLILADAAGMLADYRFLAHLRACRHPIEVKCLFELHPQRAIEGVHHG